MSRMNLSKRVFLEINTRQTNHNHSYNIDMTYIYPFSYVFIFSNEYFNT